MLIFAIFFPSNFIIVCIQITVHTELENFFWLRFRQNLPVPVSEHSIPSVNCSGKTEGFGGKNHGGIPFNR